MVLEIKNNVFNALGDEGLFPRNSIVAPKGVDSGDTGEKFKIKIIDIGSWDMDTDSNKSIAHGLNFEDIRSINVNIQRDGGTTIIPLTYGNLAFQTPEGNWEVIGDDIKLNRRSGGSFDSTTYDDSTINRGWITIVYSE